MLKKTDLSKTLKPSSAPSISSSPTPSDSFSCPSYNNTVQPMRPDGEVYRIHCGSDFGQGKKELMMIHDTTFQSCLSICDSMNLIQNRSDVGCTFYDEDSLFERAGTCWCVGNTTKIVHENGRNVAIPQRR